MHIRDARAGDARAITAIYNHFILNTTVTFEEEAQTPAALAQRIADVQAQGLPWLVAEQDGELIGYAYATAWRARRAYRYSAESS
ncbi:MAG: N-acetyltransferase family protein, partial [Gammaproteobacteria bacterium]